jgi:cell wall-associated NlpC family hydrolase
MRMQRLIGASVAALVLAAAAAATGFAATGDSDAAPRVAKIAPVPSPLAVPPVLERAAQRLERAPSRPAATVQMKEREPEPEPERAALPSGAGGDVALVSADVLENGIALPPLEAPEEVRRIIEAGNAIARTPYKWGGGHGRWLDTGYDCSGSVSFALASAGLLAGPLDSGRLMSWGSPGPGRWITIWSNPGHVFLVVAGVRFDTSGARVTGSRWQAAMRSTDGFVARHPAGL